MRVRDAEQAVALANGSRYGLAASIFTRDAAAGARLARRLGVGVACVNDAQVH